MANFNKVKVLLSTGTVLLVLWFPLHLLPKTNTHNLYQHTDKIIHFSLFLMWTSINFKLLKNKKNVFLFSALLAIVSELGQVLIPFRNFEVLDLAFDLFGAVPVLCYMALKKLPNEH